jgi:hypothetical protein
MRFFAVKHKVTGKIVKIGRAKRFAWDHFPTNVMKQNIPENELMDYEILLFDLQLIKPLRRYNMKRQIIK